MTELFTIDELIEHIDKIEFKNIDNLPKNILMKFKNIITTYKWGEISNKTYSKKILTSPEFFDHINWTSIIHRMQLTKDLVDKIITKRKIFDCAFIFSRMKISREQYHQLIKSFNQTEHHVNYFMNQDFDIDDLKSFLKDPFKKINTNVLNGYMHLISHNPSLCFDVIKDGNILKLLDLKFHLGCVNYSSDVLVFNILPSLTSNTLNKLFESTSTGVCINGATGLTTSPISPPNFLSYQKDITQDLIDYLINLKVNQSSIITYLSMNPHVDLKKFQIVRQSINTGFINPTTLIWHRKLPMWLIDKHFLTDLDHSLLSQVYNLDNHFISRKIRELLPKYPNTNINYISTFLEDLIRYYNFDIPFLRALCNLIIDLNLAPKTTNFWIVLSGYQDLDLKFIQDYIKYLDPRVIQLTQEITIELIDYLDIMKLINWNWILSNKSFYNLTINEQYKQAINNALKKTPISIYYDLQFGTQNTPNKTTTISPLLPGFNINSPENYIKLFINFQLFVKSSEKLDFRKLKKGHTYNFTYSNNELYPRGFMIKSYIADAYSYSGSSYPLNVLRLAKVIYENNPILLHFPTFLRIEYQLTTITNPKGFPIYHKFTYFDSGYLISSFKVLDVKYITDVDPFQYSLED
jgi:hypothetical protein